MAIITLIETDQQWFKSAVGFGGIIETCRDDSFCAWTLLSAAPECLVVPDALADVRFERNPYVIAGPALRSYISAPLVSTTGARLGTLCLIDTVTRHFTAQDCSLLCNAAEVAVREFEARHADAQLAYGAGEDEPGALRSNKAWDVGILVVTIRTLPRDA